MVDITRRLFDATRDRRVVEMRYFSAASNRAKTYTVEPYRLTLAQGGVYLVGWVPQYDEFRTFAVERIEKLSVSAQTFKKTRELPDDLFGSSLGVFRGEPERVVVEFDARLAPFVRGRAWHDSQTTRGPRRWTREDDARRLERLGTSELADGLRRRRARRRTATSGRRDRPGTREMRQPGIAPRRT